jgi:hypothetical protein
LIKQCRFLNEIGVFFVYRRQQILPVGTGDRNNEKRR